MSTPHTTLYSESDYPRLIRDNKIVDEYRSQFRIDYGRLVHSPAFRRLSGKTQLYPGAESDFFRNRLSHSIEVAQIAKSIALKLSSDKRESQKLDVDYDLIEFAALAHDIGHPPFGHQGEAALDSLMINSGGFEGNAQTLRVLTRIEKKVLDESNAPFGVDNFGKDVRVGLNLTRRSLASILKYDSEIPIKRNEDKSKLAKGYYASEKHIVDFVKKGFDLNEGSFRTIECSIMDIADDIAYSTYDLEDGLKAEFFHPLEMIFSRDNLLKKVTERINEKLHERYSLNDIRDVLVDLFRESIFEKNLPFSNEDYDINSTDVAVALIGKPYKQSKKISKQGWFRTALTSSLVSSFIKGVKLKKNPKDIRLSTVKFDDDTLLKVEVLKTFNFESMIQSPRLKLAEFRGKEIVTEIFTTLDDKSGNGSKLLPEDYRDLYSSFRTDEEKKRVICDFIACMTDRYCIEFYGRLKSEDPQTIFKPF